MVSLEENYVVMFVKSFLGYHFSFEFKIFLGSEYEKMYRTTLHYASLDAPVNDHPSIFPLFCIKFINL